MDSLCNRHNLLLPYRSARSLAFCLLAPLLLAPALPLSAAQSQSAMSASSCNEYKKTDAELNQVYSAIQKAHHADAHFLTAFKASQRAWLMFRDAELKAKFPEPDAASYYGSVYPMCSCGFLEGLTSQRVQQLRQTWLQTAEEGDVCAGSSARPQ